MIPPQNIFTGQWRVISLWCNLVDEGWVLRKRYPRGSFNWDFTQIMVVDLEFGKHAYFEGKLKAHFEEEPEESIDYAWYPEERELYIDRPDFPHTVRCRNVCFGKRYRVEHIRGDEYWLYDLDGVKEEPGGYRFRMKARKDNLIVPFF